MKLPWARNDELSGAKVIIRFASAENHRTSFEKDDLNALITMRVLAPILRAACIPKSNAIQPWQDVLRNGPAGIVSFRKGMKFDFTFAHGPRLRLATVNSKSLAVRSINGTARHAMFNILRRMILQEVVAANLAKWR